MTCTGVLAPPQFGCRGRTSCCPLWVTRVRLRRALARHYGDFAGDPIHAGRLFRSVRACSVPFMIVSTSGVRRAAMINLKIAMHRALATSDGADPFIWPGGVDRMGHNR